VLKNGHVDNSELGIDINNNGRRSIKFDSSAISLKRDNGNTLILPIYSGQGDAMKEFYKMIHNSYGKHLLVIDRVSR
jgi:hypothetical protein